MGPDAIPMRDGEGEILKADPLRGTRAGTLETKWNDRQFYDQLQEGKNWQSGNPQPRTTFQRGMDALRNLLKLVPHD